MTEQEVVSLKEYFDEKFKAIDKAQELYARNMDLHLERLNGEYERINQIQEKSVSAELYRVEHENACQRIEAFERSISRMDGKADQSSVNKVMLISGLGVLMAFISILLGIFGK